MTVKSYGYVSSGHSPLRITWHAGTTGGGYYPGDHAHAQFGLSMASGTAPTAGGGAGTVTGPVPSWPTRFPIMINFFLIFSTTPWLITTRRTSQICLFDRSSSRSSAPVSDGNHGQPLVRLLVCWLCRWYGKLWRQIRGAIPPTPYIPGNGWNPPSQRGCCGHRCRWTVFLR